MADVFTPEKRSWVMSRIRGKHTKIEKKMKKILGTSGIKSKQHPKIFGNPDFLVEKKVLIFCDGDFWHGHDYENKKKLSKKFWRQKIEGNMRRDRMVSRRLRREGFSVIRLWEHDIEKNPDMCLRRILRIMKKR